MTTNRIRALALITLLALSVAVAGVAAVAEEDEPEPELEVQYDEFRTSDDLVDDVVETGDAEYIQQNTRVTVEEDDAFVRVGFENPNSYAVEYEVQIDESIVDPATLGTVRAIDGDAEAYWEASHDFDADATYTRVTIVVPADTNVLLAPNQLRIKSLSWTGDAEQQAETWRDRLTQWRDDDDLEQREYEFDGEAGDQVTIDLTHPDTDERVDNWHATYRLDDGDLDRPLAEGSGQPVFYRGLEDEDGELEGIQVTFNEQADVRLVVEPTMRESVTHQWTSYRASLEDSLSIPFLSVVSAL